MRARDPATRDWEAELDVTTSGARAAGSGGSRTPRPTRSSAPLHERSRRRLPAAARAPARLHARHARPIPRTCSCRRRRSAPSSCAPTAAATSPTTGPGQLVGYPIVTLPEWRAGHARRRRLRAPRSRQCSSTRSPTSASTRGAVTTGTRACGCGDEKIAAIGVQVARGRTRARLRAQRRSRPRDVRATSSRAASPTGASRRWPRVLGDAPGDARGRRRRASRRSPSTSRTATSNARTSCGANTPTICRRSRAMARSRRAAAAQAPVRLLGRLAEAASRRRSEDPAPPSGVDAGARPTSAPATARRSGSMREPRPAHGVRGGRLPEHLRVLGRPHRDVHDPRRPVHACVRLLPGRHPQAAAARPRRARARRRRGRANSGLAHAVITAWRATTSPTAAPRGFAATIARRARRARRDTTVEVLIPDCKGDADALDVIFDGPARRAEPQPRDGGAAPAGGAAVGGVLPLARACWRGRRTPGSRRSRGIILGHGRDGRRAARRDRRPAQRRRRHPHARPVPPPVGPAPAGGRGGGRPTSSTTSAPTPRPGLRPRRGGPARPLQLPRPQAAASTEHVPAAAGCLVDGPGPRRDHRRAGRVHRRPAVFFVATAPDRRRPREPVAQGPRHVHGPRPDTRSRTSISPAAASRPSPTCARTVASRSCSARSTASRTSCASTGAARCSRPASPRRTRCCPASASTPERGR